MHSPTVVVYNRIAVAVALGVLALTLVCGVTLGLCCNEGLNFIDAETGNWKLPGSGK